MTVERSVKELKAQSANKVLTVLPDEKSVVIDGQKIILPETAWELLTALGSGEEWHSTADLGKVLNVHPSEISPRMRRLRHVLNESGKPRFTQSRLVERDDRRRKEHRVVTIIGKPNAAGSQKAEEGGAKNFSKLTPSAALLLARTFYSLTPRESEAVGIMVDEQDKAGLFGIIEELRPFSSNTTKTREAGQYLVEHFIPAFQKDVSGIMKINEGSSSATTLLNLLRRMIKSEETAKQLAIILQERARPGVAQIRFRRNLE